MAQNIIISTGNIPGEYTVVDSVMSWAGDKAGMFHDINPSAVFEDLKNNLRTTCLNLGGDAVIYTSFEYRNALAGSKQAFEIYAYGTVVKRH